MLFSATGITVAKRGRAFMEEFLKMGGYGQYVWPAYAFSAFAIGGLALSIWRRGRALRRRIEALHPPDKKDAL
jgi:heme exporter protein CcmD